MVNSTTRPRLSGVKSHTTTKTILVVEDDQLFSELVGTVLREIGMLPVRVARLEDAMRLLETLNFDAAIVDLGLPDGSGFDFVQAMRTSGMHNKVMIVTGAETSQVGNVLAQIEGDHDTAFFQKPISLQKFRETLAHISQ